MKQAAEANTQALIEKERRKQEERDQDNAIREHQRKKDQREFEAQVEAQRIKDEKRDKLDCVKSSSTRRDCVLLLTLRLLARDSSRRSR
jgi:hypothetical protein